MCFRNKVPGIRCYLRKDTCCERLCFLASLDHGASQGACSARDPRARVAIGSLDDVSSTSTWYSMYHSQPQEDHRADGRQ